MEKEYHEIRDPIHTFVRHNSDERKVLDSRPFQRLRHIHQLALTYLVYPGATHKRFEHSLGVMELASRVFDIVTNPGNIAESIRDRISDLRNAEGLGYWRRALRMAALCHDIGHLPFSHAAEAELLPNGWDHERLTQDLIQSDEMETIWKKMTPPLRSEDIVKLAIGPKHAAKLKFSDWELILSEIIVGDAFGADRMDYLLRDSHHTGVAYGRFDHFRLVDTLRILPAPAEGDGNATVPTLGLQVGGIHSAEALMLARYFMYSQVYVHPIRRIYDIHLMDFLKDWLPDNSFSVDLERHLSITDNEISEAIRKSAANREAASCVHARRIVERDHFKQVYARNPIDVNINPEAGAAVYEQLCYSLGAENVRRDVYKPKGGPPEFPVQLQNGDIESSLSVSDVLQQLPVVSTDFVFVERSRYDEASQWLRTNRERVIEPVKEEEDEAPNEDGSGHTAD